jgi:hypothetical protein
LLGLGLFFSFLVLYTVGRTPCTGDQPVARPLPTHRTTHTIKPHNTDNHTLSGIRTHNPSIRASENSSSLDRAATVVGCSIMQAYNICTAQIIIMIQFDSIYLFTCILNSPEANYKASTRGKNIHIQTKSKSKTMLITIIIMIIIIP